MNKPRYIVGIDPDVEKSGVAILDMAAKSFVSVEALPLSDVILKLSSLNVKRLSHLDWIIPIVLEDSDSTTNWHIDKLEYAPLTIKQKLRKAAAMGHGTGMCHATQRHIKEWAENLKLEVVLQKPLKKTWMGPDGKITHEECMQFMAGLPKRTNPEMRDAALLAWNYANLPIHISAIFYIQNKKK